MKNKKYLIMKYTLLFAFCLGFQSKLVSQELNGWDFFVLNPDLKTDALVVFQNNQVVYEKYNHQFDSKTKHMVWSISKSLTSTVLGAMAYQNKFSSKQFRQINVTEISSKIDKKYSYITLDHFLSWSSGIQWNESYENNSSDPTQSSVAQLLYGDGVENSFEFIWQLPIQKPANSVFSNWNYSTGDSHMALQLGQLIQKNIISHEKSIPSEIAQKYLFQQLEINDVTLLKDSTGYLAGGSGFYMTAYDLLKIGKLYLNNGKYNDHVILGTDWIQDSFKNPPLFQENQNLFQPLKSWWTLSTDAKQKHQLPDMILAIGHWDQYLIIIPSLNAVIVRFGLNQKSSFPILNFLKKANQLLNPNTKLAFSLPKKDFVNLKTNESTNLNVPAFKSNIFTLGKRYRALHMCQCLFVMKQSKSYCEELSQVNPPVFKIAKITENSVTAELIGKVPGSSEVDLMAVTATFLNNQYGCEFN